MINFTHVDPVFVDVPLAGRARAGVWWFGQSRAAVPGQRILLSAATTMIAGRFNSSGSITQSGNRGDQEILTRGCATCTSGATVGAETNSAQWTSQRYKAPPSHLPMSHLSMRRRPKGGGGRGSQRPHGPRL